MQKNLYYLHEFTCITKYGRHNMIICTYAYNASAGYDFTTGRLPDVFPNWDW